MPSLSQQAEASLRSYFLMVGLSLGTLVASWFERARQYKGYILDGKGRFTKESNTTWLPIPRAWPPPLSGEWRLHRNRLVVGRFFSVPVRCRVHWPTSTQTIAMLKRHNLD
jgi:hypothetical protein